MSNNTPIDKIRRGIRALERGENLRNLTNAPASISGFNKIAEKADRKLTRLKDIAAEVSSAVEKERKKIEMRFADLGKSEDENGVIRDNLGPDKRKAMIEKEVQKFRKKILANSADERSAIQNSLRQYRQTVESVKEAWLDPVTILKRKTLADPKRAIYSQNLNFSGPKEISLFLQEAIVTNDLALAAAAFQRLDSMNKETRKLVSFTKNGVAEILVHDDYFNAQQYIAMVDIADAEGDMTMDRIEGKSIASTKKIGLGIKKQDFEKLMASSGSNLDAAV